MAVHRHFGKFVALAGALFVGVGMIAPASASGGPPGDNGTVKVDGWEVDGTPANEPHIGCEFGIDFYGYEAGLPVTMEFWVQPPTGQEEMIHRSTGTLDDDDATGGSDAGWDGHFDIDLSDALDPYAPHPEQGYHLKLVVTVDDGVGGNSIVKHKVFWTTACEPPTTTTTTSTTVPETTTTSTSTTVPETTTTTSTTVPETTTTSTSTTVPETTTTTSTTVPETTTTSTSTTIPETTTTTAQVEGTNVTQTTAGPPTEVLGVQLVRTGFSTAMLVLGTSLLVLGLVIELLQRAAVRRAS